MEKRGFAGRVNLFCVKGVVWESAFASFVGRLTRLLSSDSSALIRWVLCGHDTTRKLSPPLSICPAMASSFMSSRVRCGGAFGCVWQWPWPKLFGSGQTYNVWAVA
eukprot:6482549-Amphidinium_carterae.1